MKKKLTKEQEEREFMLDTLDYLEGLFDINYDEDWDSQDIAKVHNGIEKIKKAILKYD